MHVHGIAAGRTAKSIFAPLAKKKGGGEANDLIDGKVVAVHFADEGEGPARQVVGLDPAPPHVVVRAYTQAK